MTNKEMEKLLEKLSEIEHNQWMKWASTLMAKEKLSPERIERWKKDMVPYQELPEEVKEYDRKWARLGLELLQSAIHKTEKRMIEEIEKAFYERDSGGMIIYDHQDWEKLKKKLLTHSSQKK